MLYIQTAITELFVPYGHDISPSNSCILMACSVGCIYKTSWPVWLQSRQRCRPAVTNIAWRQFARSCKSNRTETNIPIIVEHRYLWRHYYHYHWYESVHSLSKWEHLFVCVCCRKPQTVLLHPNVACVFAKMEPLQIFGGCVPERRPGGERIARRAVGKVEYGALVSKA